MSFNSTLSNLETAENLETVLKLLSEVAPQNLNVQREVEKISKSTTTQIRQLTTRWESRKQPFWSEISLREQNSQYLAEQKQNTVIKQSLDLQLCDVEARNFIVKSSSVWRGFHLETGAYLPDPLIFEGSLDFARNFEPLVIVDRDSQAVNLIWSIQKLICKGEQMGLSQNLYVQLFLTFCKNFIPTAFQAVSRYSDDLDGLFTTMVSNVNSLHEVGKLRHSLSKLSRKPGETIAPVLFRLRSLYEMILAINFPSMTEAQIVLSADSYAGQAAKSLVSANTAELIDRYVQYNIQKNRPNTVLALSDLITKHETTSPSDKISSPKFLPEEKCKLDLNQFQAHNVQDLLVASTRFSHNGDRRDRHSSANKSLRNRSDSRNRYRTASKDRTFSSGHSRPSQRSNSDTRQRYSSRGRPDRRSISRQRDPRHNSRDYGYRSTSRDRGRHRSRDKHGHGSSAHKPHRTSGNTPVRSGSVNKGRYARPRSSTPRPQQVKCVRCGGPHQASSCPIYPFWDGPPCSRCNLLHSTKSHRDRSNSRDRHVGRDSDLYSIPDHKYRDSSSHRAQLANVQPAEYNNIFSKN